MSQKNLFFYLINALVLVDMTTYVFLVPILPDYLLKKGISLSIIGVIFSFFQISSVITSLYLGKNLMYYSKIKMIIEGQILLVISNIGLGFLDFFSINAVIILLAILFRLIQGASTAFVLSTCYSYIPILFPQNLEASFAFIEITVGLGLSIGPVIAGFLYQYTGFKWSFLIISFCYAVAGLLIFPFMIKTNRIIEEEAEMHNEKNKGKVRNLGVFELVKNRNFLLTSGVFLVSFMAYCIIQPDFSQHIHSYNGTDDTVGMIFGLSDLMYAVTGILVIKYITNMHLPRKYIFLLGGFLSMLSLLIIGPDDITFLPKNLIVVTIGMIVLGCSQMFYFPIFIPEILDILKEIDPNAQGSEEMASAIFIAALGVTSFLGSILGGCLTEEFGFSRGVTVYAGALIVALCVYAVMQKNPENYDGKTKDEVISLELALIGNDQKRV